MRENVKKEHHFCRWLGTLATVLTVALAVVVGAVLLPNTMQTAEAETVESGTCGSNLTWTLDNTGTLTISGAGEMNNYTSNNRPPWYSNKSAIMHVTVENGVTSIGYLAFAGCTGLTSITIPDSVTSIGDYAFSSCSSLTSITIPDSVTSIGDHAFSSCSSLTNIMIPGSVTSLGDNAFWNCSSLTSITIPDSVTSIGDYAFWNCSSLTSITIPDSVTSIGDYAFYNCTGLTSITIGNSVTSIGKWAFSGCSSLTSITIPEGVTSIERDAFAACTSLTSITIPDSVTSIGNYAFTGCTGLTDVTIGNGVSNIGDVAFNYCTNLMSITIPDSVTSIGAWAFEDCTSLVNITIPDSVTSIGSWVFRNCTSLQSVTLPGNVANVGTELFNKCDKLSAATFTGTTITSMITELLPRAQLREITISDSVTSIGNYAFSYCPNLTSMTIPGNLTSIGTNAFDSHSNVTHATFTGTKITRAVAKAFPYTGLTGITISDSVTSIEVDAFYGYGSLTGITIPDSVTSIESYAFYNCTGLTSIRFLGNAPEIGVNAFFNVNANAYYPIHNSTWTGSVRQNYGGNLTWESYLPSLTFFAASLTLENNLKVNLWVEKSLFTNVGYTSPYVVFTLDGKETTVSAYTVKDNYYVFSLDEVTPDQMNDTINATLYATYNDEVYSSSELTYSVTQYCYNMLSDSNSSAKLRTLLVDLLRYGAAAQRYTGHNTAALADAMLTAEQAAWGTQSDPALTSVTNAKYAAVSEPQVGWAAVGLQLGNGVTMKFYFAAEDTDGLTLRITDQSGALLQEIGVKGFEITAGYYVAHYRGINAGELSKTVYVTAYRGGVPVSNTLAYSVESYAYAKQNDADAELAALVKALMNYGNAAYTYAH